MAKYTRKYINAFLPLVAKALEILALDSGATLSYRVINTPYDLEAIHQFLKTLTERELEEASIGEDDLMTRICKPCPDFPKFMYDMFEKLGN